MAGHSKFKNIQHRKGAQDAKRAKIFTRVVREITIAARSGADPEFNPALRAAMIAARAVNLPKERIDRALKADSDSDDNYEEIRYEGFLPGGVALIVEALTDNRNRTASHVRSIFNKYGGHLGETGSVSFMFDRIGEIRYAQSTCSDDKAMELGLEASATDVESDQEWHCFYTTRESFSSVLEILASHLGQPESAEVIWKAQNAIDIEDEERVGKILKMIDALEESEDVQNVFCNCI